MRQDARWDETLQIPHNTAGGMETVTDGATGSDVPLNTTMEHVASVIDKDLSKIPALKTTEDLNLLPDAEQPVYQTDFTPEKGNSLQACFAAMFRIELRQVPNFVQHPGKRESDHSHDCFRCLSTFP